MQLIHNNLLTDEENAKIEKQLDMKPEQEFEETEKWLNERDEEDETVEKEMAELEALTVEQPEELSELSELSEPEVTTDPSPLFLPLYALPVLS